MADPESTDELNQKEARLKAEAAYLRAQADLRKAQAEFAATSKTPDFALVAASDEKARIEAQKAVWEAAKGLSDARKVAAVADAQAKIGTVAGSNIEGSVTAKADAGKGEATLLAARAIRHAAEQVVAGIEATGKHIVLIDGIESPQLSNYRQFLLHQAIVKRIFEHSQAEADRLLKKQGGLEADLALETAPLLTTAGVALDAAAKLGSYFMTNYEAGGIALATDTQQLVSAVAEQLLAKGVLVVLPAHRLPQSSEFTSMLEELAKHISEAEARIQRLNAYAQEAKVAGNREVDEVKKEHLQKATENYEQGVALLGKAISRAEEFIASLALADSKGTLLITKIAQEKAVYDELNSGALALFLDVRSMAGAYYTKRNLWTFFGAMPFFVMGGAVITYRVVDNHGNMRGSGLIPVHSGYMAVSEIPTLMK